MQIFLDNYKISNYSLIDYGINSLGYDTLNESFFDIFEIKNKELEIIKEKRGEFNGNIVVQMNLKIEDKIYENVDFVLNKENKTCINSHFINDYKKTKKQTTFLKESTKQVLKENKIVKNKKVIYESVKNEILEDLKKEIKTGIISNVIKDNLQLNFNSLLRTDDNKTALSKILEEYNTSFRRQYIEIAEKISKREALRYIESGGGTNAVQYSNGGTMNGDLTINGSLISNSIVNQNGNSFTTKIIKNISGSSFVNGQLTITHNLNTYELISSLYYINNSGLMEMVYASIINDTPNTIQINFSNQPNNTDNFKLIIIS